MTIAVDLGRKATKTNYAYMGEDIVFVFGTVKDSRFLRHCLLLWTSKMSLDK